MRNLLCRSWLLLCLMLAPIGMIGCIADGANQPARAQDADFDYHDVLGAYGQFVIHPQWGEVWIPASMPADWAPYRYGHWVFTDEWGWYWVADEDWGWVPYHYGRWVLDADMGWIWIPGTDWSPAWVSWRRGDEAVGWAPMPPDEVIDEYEDRPEYWVFVRPVDIFAPRIVTVVFPAPQIRIFVSQTVVVNRTILMVGGNNRAAANPGIPASFIALKIGHPIQTVAIQPHVMRGTIGVTGAVVASVGVGIKIHEQVNVQAAVIQPAASVSPPVRFQPGKANFGPDAPASLKRASGSGWQVTTRTSTPVQQHGPAQGNMHPQGGPGGQPQSIGTNQRPQGNQPGSPGGAPVQGNLQHPQGGPGGQQQSLGTNQHPQGGNQPGPSGGGPVQGNLEHHEEHHEELQKPPAPQQSVAKPPQPAAPPPPKAAEKPAEKPKTAEKKCEKVNGKEVCK
jgi:hypothetical protein